MVKSTLIPFLNLIELSCTQLIHVLKDHGKLNKKEGPSAHTPNPIGRRNKMIMRGRGRKEPGWGKGGAIRYRGRQERSPKCQKNELKFAAVRARDKGNL